MSFPRYKQYVREFLSIKIMRFQMKRIIIQKKIKRFIWLRGKIQKILIIRIASIGDVIRANLIVDRLKKKYPLADIDFLTSDITMEVIKYNPSVHRVYCVNDLTEIPKQYDWVVNLQASEPPGSFLRQSGLTYRQFLEYISEKIESKLITGRQFKNGKEIRPTIIYSCEAEFEEFATIALLKFSPQMVSLPRFRKNPDFIPDKSIADTLLFRDQSKLLIGIFIGSASDGDHDGGSRTYSINYLGSLIRTLSSEYSIAVFGQSSVKSKSDQKALQLLLNENPEVINLVDRTDLTNLLWAISKMSLVISSDSGPVHMAIGLGVPLVALYAKGSSFRMSTQRIAEKYVLLDALKPCWKYTMEWKFFCQGCEEWRYQLFHCNHKKIPAWDEAIPPLSVMNAVHLLLKKKL